MSSPGRIGVVTVTFNSEPVIDEFLASMLGQTHSDFLLFIVDNASSDQTLAKVAQHQDPRVTVIANPGNFGVAKGNNQGIEAALNSACEAILLLNNDTVFGADFLEKLVAAQEQIGCDMIGPKVMFHDDPRIIWWAGGRFNRRRAFSLIHYGMHEIDHGQFEQVRQVEYAPTCCLLVKRSVFERIGLMDERYFVYFDDVDFCFRAKQAGLSLFYLPSCTLFHKVSSLTGGVESKFTLRYCTRSRVYFILKNLGKLEALLYLAELQVYFLARLLLRADTFEIFRWKQKAFFEGVQVWKE